MREKPIDLSATKHNHREKFCRRNSAALFQPPADAEERETIFGSSNENVHNVPAAYPFGSAPCAATAARGLDFPLQRKKDHKIKSEFMRRKRKRRT